MSQEVSELLVAYHGNVSEEARKQAEQRLIQIQSSPNSHLMALEVLEAPLPSALSQADLLLLQFSGSILELVVRRRWEQLAPPERQRGKHAMVRANLLLYGNAPPWVTTKLAAALAGVGRMAWPNQDPGFLAELEGLTRDEATRPVGLFLLRMALEELVREDVPLLTVRRRQISEALRGAMPDLLRLLSAAVDVAWGSVSGAAQASHAGTGSANANAHRDALKESLRCLLVIIGWAPLGEHLEAAPFAALFGIVEAAARADAAALDARLAAPSCSLPAAELAELAADAMAVVTEVLSKRLVPQRLRDFVHQLAGHVLALLRALAADGGALADALEEQLLLQIAECVREFVQQLLPRLLRLAGEEREGGQATTGGGGDAALALELLRALEAFTLLQASATGLDRFVRTWGIFAALAHEHEGGDGQAAAAAGLARQYAQGLGGLCEALMGKVLFMTNSDMLSELGDDDSSNVGGGGGGSSGTATAWEDDAGVPETGAVHFAGSSSSGGGGDSELQEFIGGVTELLLALSQIPPLGQLVAERAVELFGRVLGELGGALGAGGGQEALEQAARLACDAATLSRLMPAAAAGGGATDLFLRAATAAADAAKAMLAAELHTRGAAYARLEAAVLRALQSLAPGIAAAAAAGATAQAAALLDSIVGAVRAAWAPSAANGAAAAPAAAATAAAAMVQRAAGQLLCTLPLRLPPELLSESSALMQLLSDASGVATVLPVAARVLLYRALGAFLLPPALMRGAGSLKRSTDFEGRSRAYAALVAPLLPPLVNGAEGSPAAVDFAGVEASSRVLAVLVWSVAAAPLQLKQVCHEGLGPALPAAVALLERCLRAARANLNVPGASAAATAVMQLLVAAATSLTSQAGADLVAGPVTALVAVFRDGSGGGGGGGGSGGSGGLRLVATAYRLLATVMELRSKTTAPLATQVCQLALDTLAEARSSGGDHYGGGSGGFAALNAVAELYPDFLKLAEQLLTTQWHCFVVTDLNSGSGAQGQRRFASDAAAAQFSRMCAVLLDCVDGGGSGRVPPDAARLGVALLLRAEEMNRLLAFAPFAAEWAPRMALACVRGLFRRAHSLLHDELMRLSHALWRASPAALERSLETLLGESGGLREDRPAALAALWAAEVSADAAGFGRALEGFCNDLRYYCMVDGVQVGP